MYTPDHQTNVHPYQTTKSLSYMLYQTHPYQNTKSPSIYCTMFTLTKPPNHPPTCCAQLTLSTVNRVPVATWLGNPSVSCLFPWLTQPEGTARCFGLPFPHDGGLEQLLICLVLLSCLFTGKFYVRFRSLFLTGLIPSCQALKVHCLVQTQSCMRWIFCTHSHLACGFSFYLFIYSFQEFSFRCLYAWVSQSSGFTW